MTTTAGTDRRAPSRTVVRRCLGWSLGALVLAPLGLNAQYAGGPGRGDDMAGGMFTPCAILLPVELLHFRATCSQGRPLLEWATATEHNTAVFRPERSTNTAVWEPLGTVPAAGHSAQTVHYAFVDAHPAPAPVTYYRLRQQDLDGRTTMLPVVTLARCGGTDHVLAVHPNPATDMLWVGLPAVEGPHRLELTEATGRAVRHLQLAPGAVLRTAEFPLAGLAEGSYQLSLCDDQGNRLAWARIIKQ